MSQEQYEKLPMSPQHQLEFLNKQKAELLDQLLQSKHDNGRRDPTVKEIESAIKKTESRIETIMNPKSKSRGKDSLLNFESLGFDYLVVDEAHAYKNGFVSTKMGDVSGVNTRESGRAGDMQMKCDYFNSELGNGHILFCTGTPVSNSMTELYVMTRYLRPDLLEDCGCARFDDCAATFGMIKTQNKKTATGELKLKTCFSGFKNLPELITMYKEFADLVTLKQLIDDPDSKIVVPAIKGGKNQIIEVEATPEQRKIVKDFARRGREIQLGNVRPDEDNLLKITGEARLVGLGNRAVASVYKKNGWELPPGFVLDDKSGKIDACKKLTDRKQINSYLAKQIQLRIEKPYDEIPSFKVGDFRIAVAMSADRGHPDFAIMGERSVAYRIGVGVGENTDNCQRLMNFFDSVIEKTIEKDTQSMEKDISDCKSVKEGTDVVITYLGRVLDVDFKSNDINGKMNELISNIEQKYSVEYEKLPIYKVIQEIHDRSKKAIKEINALINIEKYVFTELNNHSVNNSTIERLKDFKGKLDKDKKDKDKHNTVNPYWGIADEFVSFINKVVYSDDVIDDNILNELSSIIAEISKYNDDDAFKYCKFYKLLNERKEKRQKAAKELAVSNEKEEEKPELATLT